MSKHHGTMENLHNMIEQTGTPGSACNMMFGHNFGRLWPAKAHQPFSKDDLVKLAGQMAKDCGEGLDADAPAGFAFLGQFIDHDITLDATTKLAQAAGDPLKVENFRSPRLDLDSVYLHGPEVDPHLYESTNGPGNGIKLLVGTDANPKDVQRIQRNGVASTAIIGDPRNDENLFISQTQSMFIRFHNYVADRLEAQGVPAGERFEKAREICRWTYQWVVLNEFLPAVVQGNVLSGYVDGYNHGVLPGPISWIHAPQIPVEFSAAIYRFGHSFVRETYTLNDLRDNVGLFDHPGFTPLSENENVDWKYLLDFGCGSFLRAKNIDTKLASSLFDLEFIQKPSPDPMKVRNLASRNLLRGQFTFLLPTGEDLAKSLGVTPIKPHKLIKKIGLSATPLWFYVLAEAEYLGGKLGPVGGQIVAGTLLQMLLRDEDSIKHAGSGFSPHEFLEIEPDKSVLAEMARKVN